MVRGTISRKDWFSNPLDQVSHTLGGNGSSTKLQEFRPIPPEVTQIIRGKGEKTLLEKEKI